jgi:hypothetical protein
VDTVLINTLNMADEKVQRSSREEKISPVSGEVGDMPTKDVITDDPTQAEFYRQFAENGAEWRADFEKKLKWKVDIRLIPLLVRAKDTLLYTADSSGHHVHQQLHGPICSRSGTSWNAGRGSRHGS